MNELAYRAERPRYMLTRTLPPDVAPERVDRTVVFPVHDRLIPISRDEARALAEAGEAVYIRYTAMWTVPSGASGWDVGWAAYRDGYLHADRVFGVRAHPRVRELFGGTPDYHFDFFRGEDD